MDETGVGEAGEGVGLAASVVVLGELIFSTMGFVIMLELGEMRGDE